MKLAQLDYDREKVDGGVWFNDPVYPEVEFLVFLTSSPRFRAVMASKHKALKDARTPEEREAVVKEIFAEGVLGGWRGIEDVSEEYNTEDALRIVNNQRVRGLLDDWANTDSFYLQQEDQSLGED